MLTKKPIKRHEPNNIEAIKPSGLSKAALGLFSSLRLASILLAPPGHEQTAEATAIANCDNLPVQLATCYGNCYTDVYQIPGHEEEICFTDDALCDNCYADCYGNCYDNWSSDCHNDCHSDCHSACVACDEGDGSGNGDCDPDFEECNPDNGGT